MPSDHNFEAEAEKFSLALYERVLNDTDAGFDEKGGAVFATLEKLSNRQDRSIEQFRLETAFDNLCLRSYELYGSYKPAYDEIGAIGMWVEANLGRATSEEVEQMANALLRLSDRIIIQTCAAGMGPPQALFRKKTECSHLEMNPQMTDPRRCRVTEDTKTSLAAHSSSDHKGNGAGVDDMGAADEYNMVVGMKARNVAQPSIEAANSSKFGLLTVTDIDDLGEYLNGAARKSKIQMKQNGISIKGYYEHFLGGVVLKRKNTQRLVSLVDVYERSLGRIKTSDGVAYGLEHHSDDPKFIRDIMKGVLSVRNAGVSPTMDSFLALETRLRAARVHTKYFGRGPKRTNERFAELAKIGELPDKWGILKPGQTYSQKSSAILHEHYNIDPHMVKTKLQPVKVLAAFIDATSTGILLFADPATVVSKFNKQVTRSVKNATAIGTSTATLMPKLIDFFNFFGNNVVEPIWERKKLKVVLTAHPEAPWVGDLLAAFELLGHHGGGDREKNAAVEHNVDGDDIGLD